MRLSRNHPLSALAALAAGLALACEDGPSSPGNRAPTVVLTVPALAATFVGGDSIDVVIVATDPDEGALGDASVSWWVVLHHAAHTHPYLPAATGTTGRFGVSRAGHEDHDVFLRVHARAIDADGVADTAFVDVAPELTTLTLTSAPAGLQVTLDGQPQVTPYSVPAIVGMERAIGAAADQVVGSVVYGFDGWSDAGAATHTVTIPDAPVTLTAAYDSIASTNARPSVTLTAPASGTVVGVGVGVTLSATAVDGDGSIASVTFFENETPVATDGSAPFSVEWIPATVGERQLVARATDDGGAIGESAPLTVTVQPAGAPVISLDSPADSTLGLIGAVALAATATDEASVTFVEFAVDGVVIAVDSTAPYEAVLSSTAAYASGAHVVRARARDGDGNHSAWASARVTFGGAVELPAGFTRTTVASGLGATPTAIAAAPDGRLFVTEQTGAVRVVKDGALLSQPFVTLAVDAYSERGLLGVAFDPEFAVNGWVYLYHTSLVGGAHNRISRFTAAGDVAAPGSEVALVDLPALGAAGKHNGGAMRFGPDGLLYVAVGDAGESSNAQSLTTPFGKMLRFAKDGSIPTDNPFFGLTTGIARSIWARGLRNPFTFDIDPFSGRMHVNDVGQNTWEEVNVGRAGANYGWPLSEGPTLTAGQDTPLLAYRHFDSPTLFDGYAAVGAAFYSPPTVDFGSEYVGDFFFADYVNRWIYRLDAQANWAPYAFANLDEFITGLAVGPDGALYVLVATRVDRITR
jgi:glucose/arabinose dehydrogenase